MYPLIGSPSSIWERTQFIVGNSPGNGQTTAPVTFNAVKLPVDCTMVMIYAVGSGGGGGGGHSSAASTASFGGGGGSCGGLSQGLFPRFLLPDVIYVSAGAGGNGGGIAGNGLIGQCTIVSLDAYWPTQSSAAGTALLAAGGGALGQAGTTTTGTAGGSQGGGVDAFGSFYGFNPGNVGVTALNIAGQAGAGGNSGAGGGIVLLNNTTAAGHFLCNGGCGGGGAVVGNTANVGGAYTQASSAFMCIRGITTAAAVGTNGCDGVSINPYRSNDNSYPYLSTGGSGGGGNAGTNAVGGNGGNAGVGSGGGGGGGANGTGATGGTGGRGGDGFAIIMCF